MSDNCPHCDYPLAGGQCANCGRDPGEPVDRCESCGVPWLRHLGVRGTCAELQRLRAAVLTVVDAYNGVEYGHRPTFVAVCELALKETECPT